jgi:hypothetical protein
MDNSLLLISVSFFIPALNKANPLPTVNKAVDPLLLREPGSHPGSRRAGPSSKLAEDYLILGTSGIKRFRCLNKVPSLVF